MKVLVTGGAGYIGSTTCWALKERGHIPIVLDSLVTGRRDFATAHLFYEGDIADKAVLKKVFTDHPHIECAIHCAALIVVPESVSMPYHYYKENVAKSIELYHSLKEFGCEKIVFSSSASIYDVVPGFKVTEFSPLKPTNPYARTKFMMEMVLEDFCRAYEMMGVALRYFNPIGADPELRCGPYVANPTHILSSLVNVALGKREKFLITGTDFETRDGTGIRDYLHVWDLARAHVLAVEKIDKFFSEGIGYKAINLGTGNGVTVKEFVTAFENVLNRVIAKEEAPRRPGDVAGYYANAETARSLLGWQTELSLEQAISDALKWSEKEIRNVNQQKTETPSVENTASL